MDARGIGSMGMKVGHLPPFLLNELKKFFEDYKKLEKNKAVSL